MFKLACHRVLRSLLVSITCLALQAAPPAQTTGVPFLNDYTVGGAVSGSTSCTLVTIPGGGLTPFTVTVSPTAMFTVFLFSACPCRAGFVCLPPTPCAVPKTACSGFTNQSIDLDLTCPFVAIPVLPVGGKATLMVPVPAGITVGTQVGVMDPVCPAAHALFTQAYTVTT